MAVAKVSPGKDIYLLTVFQFAFAALYAWICGACFQRLPAADVLSADLLIQMAYLIVMATTVALLFQNVGQVWSDPSSAAVILSLESVFGVLFSVLFYGDPVTAPPGGWVCPDFCSRAVFRNQVRLPAAQGPAEGKGLHPGAIKE